MEKDKLHILALLVLLSSFFLVTSCSKDEATQTYSRKHFVNCFFYVPTYIELFNTMGSFGEFVTVRKRTSNGMPVLEMTNRAGTSQYQMDKTMEYFGFGLGGLIVGVNYYGEQMAFDLACPNCDRADRRLTMGEAGLVKCTKCGISYDLNNYGVISAATNTSMYTSPRGLYRYRVMYDGTNVRIYN